MVPSSMGASPRDRCFGDMSKPRIIFFALRVALKNTNFLGTSVRRLFKSGWLPAKKKYSSDQSRKYFFFNLKNS